MQSHHFPPRQWLPRERQPQRHRGTEDGSDQHDFRNGGVGGPRHTRIWCRSLRTSCTHTIAEHLIDCITVALDTRGIETPPTGQLRATAEGWTQAPG